MNCHYFSFPQFLCFTHDPTSLKSLLSDYVDWINLHSWSQLSNLLTNIYVDALNCTWVSTSTDFFGFVIMVQSWRCQIRLSHMSSLHERYLHSPISKVVEIYILHMLSLKWSETLFACDHTPPCWTKQIITSLLLKIVSSICFTVLLVVSIVTLSKKNFE